MSLEGPNDIEYVKSYVYFWIALQTIYTNLTPLAEHMSFYFFEPKETQKFSLKQGLRLSKRCLCKNKKMVFLLWADIGSHQGVWHGMRNASWFFSSPWSLDSTPWYSGHVQSLFFSELDCLFLRVKTYLSFLLILIIKEWPCLIYTLNLLLCILENTNNLLP